MKRGRDLLTWRLEGEGIEGHLWTRSALNGWMVTCDDLLDGGREGQCGGWLEMGARSLNVTRRISGTPHKLHLSLHRIIT